MPCLVNHVIDVIVSHYMHYIGLHVVLKVVTCLLLVHPEQLQALYAQYMQCQVVFLLPNEALLTQTSPATAHLVPLPRSNSSQQLICQQLRCLEALRQVQVPILWPREVSSAMSIWKDDLHQLFLHCVQGNMCIAATVTVSRIAATV
jgi:hypothetical protein